MINLLLTLLLSCGGGLTGSKTKSSDSSNFSNSSKSDTYRYKEDDLEPYRYEEDEGYYEGGYYEDDGDYENASGIEIFTNALFSGDIREFEELLKDNPNLALGDYKDYNLNEYSRGSNNLAHAIVNTSGIDKKEFLQIMKSEDLNNFNIRIKQKNGAGYFPADIAFLQRDWDTFKYLLSIGIAVDTGFSKDSLRSSIKYLIDERRMDVFEILEGVWENSRSYQGKINSVDGKDNKKSYHLYRERDDDNRDAIYYICSNLDREMFDWIMGKFPNLNIDYSSSGVVGFRTFLPDIITNARKESHGSKEDRDYMIKRVKNKWAKKEYKK